MTAPLLYIHVRRNFALAALIFGLCLPARAKGKPDSNALQSAFAAKSAALAPAAITQLQHPIILDPGHGGDDLGAVVAGRQEKDIALSIARKLKNRLKVPAQLTRDTDVFIPLDRRISESLQWNGAAFISLHLNQVKQKNLSGITVYAFGKSAYRILRRRWHHHHGPPPIPAPPREQVKDSGALARSVVRALGLAGFKVDPIARAEYYVLKNPKIPSILIELGYLSNAKEAARLSDPAYQDRLADALAKSLTEYLVASSSPKTARSLALVKN